MIARGACTERQAPKRQASRCVRRASSAEASSVEVRAPSDRSVERRGACTERRSVERRGACTDEHQIPSAEALSTKRRSAAQSAEALTPRAPQRERRSAGTERGTLARSPKRQLTRRAETLSAVDVTLDPDTASPLLTLSAEGKRVRLGWTRGLPDNPERFDRWECVLGREVFTSGRRYWQVQVGGNTSWRLGVSRESAQRKGGFSMTPQQGYWTVGWDGDKDEFIALTDPQTPLPRSLKPQKLGVYLDYEEGQLSFYNVETRSHIYTFTDMEFNLNEKLYPFFWTGDRYADLVLESPDPVSAAD
ncbi:UNVERIFIED_CONTAM: hypothetical protein FKN15_058701 [Acipenser sinensis]